MTSEPTTPLSDSRPSGSRVRRLAGIGVLLCLIVGSAFLILHSQPDITKANRYMLMGDVELARRELDRILADDPDRPAALLMKGDLLRSQSDLPEAITYYRRVPSEAKQFRQASLGHAQALLSMFDLAGAERQMQRHLEQFPDERPIWDELRWLCFNQFRTRDVIELSHWWLENHPNDTQALIDLLLGVFRPQVPQEGRPYLQQVHAKVGSQVSVLRALAWAAWRSGQRDEANRLLEQAWHTGSEDPRTRLLSAEILIEKQNFAAAARVLGTKPFGVSGEMFGSQIDRWHWLRSRVLLEKGDIAASLHQVEQAMSLYKGNLKYIHEQAVLLKQLGRDLDAAVAFGTARTVEQCKKRFAEIAFSGEWRHATPAVREELAELYQQCGDDLAARLWRQ